MSKEAQKALEWNTYSKELKVNEANTYMYRYENAEGEKSKFKKDIATISDKIIDLNTQIERINRKIEENRERITQADFRLSLLNDKRVELSVGNERKDGELRLVQERIKTYQSQIEAATTYLEGAKERIGEIDNEIALTNRKNGEDTKRVAQLETEVEVLRSAVVALDKKIEVFEKLSDENRQNQLSSADDLSKLKENLGTLAARLEATKDRMNELSTTLQKTEERKERLESDLNAVQKDLKSLRSFTSTGMREFEEKQEEAREMQLTINDFNQ